MPCSNTQPSATLSHTCHPCHTPCPTPLKHPAPPYYTRHTEKSQSPAPATSYVLLIAVKSPCLKNLWLFLQHLPIFALVNPGNHKPQNTQPSKRIVPWINIAFLRISGLLIHYHLAPSGLATMGSIIAKFTRVKISLCCVIIWVWFGPAHTTPGGEFEFCFSTGVIFISCKLILGG